ncbi:DUF1080 domain-containing protein [Polymorphobacter sp. PAMC 29334]|nr:DUF1080 domain-containing protein [Polymorphobacter sp. PAMC 29334]
MFALCLTASLPAGAVSGQASRTSYAMTSELWQGEKFTFEGAEGFPNGRMTVLDGFATLKDAVFSEGTVEFDMKPLAFADTGIQIHRQDADTAEFIYLRADPDCPAANDCVQYAPITHGRMQWNIYPQYQSSAPISEKGWNHLRIVVTGERLRLFVNRENEPSIDVPRLQGLAGTGGIAVKGPAVFANLIIRPGDRGEPTVPPLQGDQHGLVRHWLLAPPTLAPADRAPTLADAPSSGWRPLETEANGMANISRAMPHDATPALTLAWLKLTINAATAGERVMDLGFSTRAWLFLNGRQVYAGENLYYPEGKRLTPEGRFAPDNAKVKLVLHKGTNELVLAIDNAWRTSTGPIKPTPYGWAGMARFEQPEGLALQP